MRRRFKKRFRIYPLISYVLFSESNSVDASVPRNSCNAPGEASSATTLPLNLFISLLFLFFFSRANRITVKATTPTPRPTPTPTPKPTLLWEELKAGEVVLCREDGVLTGLVIAGTGVCDREVALGDIELVSREDEANVDDCSDAVRELDTNVPTGSFNCAAVAYTTGSGASNMNSVMLQHVVLTCPFLLATGDAPPLLQHHAFESRHFQYRLSTVFTFSYGITRP